MSRRSRCNGNATIMDESRHIRAGLQAAIRAVALTPPTTDDEALALLPPDDDAAALAYRRYRDLGHSPKEAIALALVKCAEVLGVVTRVALCGGVQS